MKGKNQLLVGFRGSLENLTATQAKDGDTILKGKITSMTNPKTPGQETQRGRFGITVDLARSIIAFIRDNVSTSKPTRSAYNEFTSRGVNAMNVGGHDTLIAGIPDIEFSVGDLYPFSPADDTGTPPVVNPNSVDVAYIFPYDPSSAIQDGTDQIYALTLNDTTKDWNLQANINTRGGGGSDVTVARPSTGLNYCVLFAKSVSTGITSLNKAAFTVAPDGTVNWL